MASTYEEIKGERGKTRFCTSKKNTASTAKKLNTFHEKTLHGYESYSTIRILHTNLQSKWYVVSSKHDLICIKSRNSWETKG